MNARTASWLLAAAALSQLGNTDCGAIIDDPGFDLWCGDDLCSWRLERGEVRRVPTWHAGDDGVEFLGGDTAIYQMTEVTSQDTDCIRFEAVADIDETAEVTLEMDVYGDGSVDYAQVLPSARWAPVSYRVRLETPYQGVRFRLAKRGQGRAVLAQIEAHTAEDCIDGALELPPRPLGAWCEQHGDCATGVCEGGVCGECAGAADCAPGQACGVEGDLPPHLALYHACGAPGRHGLGERCASDDECATGLCADLICSTCRAGGEPCPGGLACAQVPTVLFFAISMCGPGQGGAAGGDFCLLDADCQSGACAGAGELRLCDLDARTCDDDLDCPPPASDQPGLCVTVGTAGGSCQ